MFQCNACTILTLMYTHVVSFFSIWFQILSHCIMHSSTLYVGGPWFQSQPRGCGHPMLIAILPLNSCVTGPWVMNIPDQVAHLQSCGSTCNSCLCRYVWANQVYVSMLVSVINNVLSFLNEWKLMYVSEMCMVKVHLALYSWFTEPVFSHYSKFVHGQVCQRRRKQTLFIKWFKSKMLICSCFGVFFLWQHHSSNCS